MPRGFWERETNPLQSTASGGKMLHFAPNLWPIPCNIWSLPWLLPLARFVSRLVAFLDDLYAGVGANRSNADHVDDDMVALNDLASAYKYFSSQVSLTFRPVLYLERKSGVIFSLRRGPCLKFSFSKREMLFPHKLKLKFKLSGHPLFFLRLPSSDRPQFLAFSKKKLVTS